MIDYIEIAKKALDDFAIKSQSIELIAQSLTTIYKVIGENENKKYCLRVHTAREKNLLNSELEWVSAIAVDTGIIVAEPYKNIRNEYVTEIDGVCCSLIKWIDGENKFDEETCKLLIELMAKLHKHAFTWKIPKSFQRPSFDMNDITKTLKLLDNLHNDLINEDSIDILKKAAKKAIGIIASIDKNENTWGLIHNDLQPQNLLFFNGKMIPIDFGNCGFGFYLSDICTAFHYIPVWYREFFFNEYMKYMPLPDDYLRFAEALYIAGHIIGLGFPLGLTDTNFDWIPDYINNVANKEAIHFLNDKPFLFESAFFM